jgi:hypothetical protein
MRTRTWILALAAAALAMLLSACGGANAADTAVTAGTSCRSFESHVGGDKINIVDFTAMTGGASSPFRFRLKVHDFQSPAADGFFGAITTGQLTYSYPRQNNPEVPYVRGSAYPAEYTNGPAFGEKVRYHAREIGCNVFQVTWKETEKGDTVTHIEDFGRQQVCTNITLINRVAIPAGFDMFDKAQQLNNTALFPAASPANDANFFINLCGTMSQSAESARVWEDTLHKLVFTAR